MMCWKGGEAVKDTMRDIYDAVDEFFGGMGSRRITTYSAACAYYLFMSLVPVIMLLVSVLQYTPLTRDVVLEAVADYVPESLYEIVDYIVTSIYNGGRVALTVSILLTLWSASACMKALLRGMDSVYDAERREDYIRFSLRACFYMVIFVFILLFSFIISLLFEGFGEEPITAALSGMGIFQPMLTALVGLVPNCAVSVLLAQLYVQGAISFGSLFAGLTAGAGVGLAVLWRVNPSWKQNLFMTGLLWAVGAATGMLLQLLPL